MPALVPFVAPVLPVVSGKVTRGSKPLRFGITEG
jgi:hypothetical protein